MACYQRVIQYIPDCVKDERINITVVVECEDGTVLSAFASDTPRLRAFAGHNPLWLHSLRSDSTDWNGDILDRMEHDWLSSFRASPRKGTLLEPRNAIIDAANRYLESTAARKETECHGKPL